MVLSDDELDKIKLLMIENNKTLINDLKELFVEKSLLYKACIVIALIAIGVSVPNLSPILAIIGM